MNIYCISGFGLDYRIFYRLEIPGHTIIHIPWKALNKNETLPGYALRLAEDIDVSKPFTLIGFSFGGMCVAEIAKVLKPAKVIIIAGAKTRSELPMSIMYMRYMYLHTVVPEWVYIKVAWMMRRKYGITPKDDKLFWDMIHSMTERFRERAANCILTWKNKETIKCLHIHGTKDIIIPYRNIKNAVPIKNGSHFIILNDMVEINNLVSDYINA